VPRPTTSAAAQDGDPVGDLAHLRQLVGDQHDQPALGTQGAQNGEELLHLAGVRTAVGSSRISTRTSPARALRISMRWRTPTESAPDTAPGSPMSRPNRAARRSASSPTSPRAEAQARPLGAEGEVLGRGQLGDDGEVLVHHADAQAARLGGVARSDGATVEANLAGVGLGQAVENVHQRRLAGAVLAQEGVNLAAAQIEAHARQRLQRAEADGDVAQGEQGRRGGCLRGAQNSLDGTATWPATIPLRVSSMRAATASGIAAARAGLTTKPTTPSAIPSFVTRAAKLPLFT
jgi:hypothetical protein